MGGDMGEPMCGENGCTLCPSVDEFNRIMDEKWVEDRRQANLILGLPERFGLDSDDGLAL
jgi:hypothetical protein